MREAEEENRETEMLSETLAIKGFKVPFNACNPIGRIKANLDSCDVGTISEQLLFITHRRKHGNRCYSG